MSGQSSADSDQDAICDLCGCPDRQPDHEMWAFGGDRGDETLRVWYCTDRAQTHVTVGP